jgi:hypothetical protein
LHDMAYYIFLKSLRSLEEFRKDPHVKIPPKSPTNFQSLGKFKNPIFNSEIHFSLFSARPTLWPTQPLAQPARWPRCPRRPKPPRPAHLARASVTSSREYVFPFGSRLLSWPPPSRLSAKWGQAVSFVFLPRRPTIAAFFHRHRPPRAARPPTSRCSARYSLHTFIPLLNLPP